MAQTPVGVTPNIAPELAEQPAKPATAVKKDLQSTPPAPPVVAGPEAEVTITIPLLPIPDPGSVLPTLPPAPALPSAPALPASPKLPLELPG